MRYRILSIFLIGCAILISCKPQKEISSDYTFRTECLSLDLDGSQTLKAWGTGINRSEAIEQAKKMRFAMLFLKVFMMESRIVR